MNVNCRTNYKKCPKDVKNNNKNRAGHASEPGSDKRTEPDSRSVSGTDKRTVPDSRSVSGSAIDSFMIFYSVTWSRCQISSTYCLMVLSDVNLPEQATFIIAI